MVKHDGDDGGGEVNDLPPLGFLSVMMKAEDVPLVQDQDTAARSRRATFTTALCIFVFFVSFCPLLLFFSVSYPFYPSYHTKLTSKGRR